MRLLIALAILSALPLAAPATLDARDRALSTAFNHPGLIIGPDESAEVNLTIRNLGRVDDTFTVAVTQKPQGWETWFRSFSSVVTGIFLAGGGEGLLTFVAVPPEGAPPAPGDYRFEAEIASLDGAIRRTASLTVTIAAQTGAAQGLALSTPYPEVRGPSDGRFSFSLELKNHTGQEALAGLSVQTPQRWQATFKPSYEDKQIASIHLPKNQGRSLTLDVTPPLAAPAGIYQLKVRAEAGGGTAEKTLTVELTGTSKIRLIPAGELLSAVGEPGQPVSMNFFLVNEGTAIQPEVTFITVAPDNWQVEFDPPKLALKPGRTPAAVTMTVTPAEKALPGDYRVGLAAEGQGAKSALEIRFTVRAKTIWAWAGALMIALTLAALAWTFRRLARR